MSNCPKPLSAMSLAMLVALPVTAIAQDWSFAATTYQVASGPVASRGDAGARPDFGDAPDGLDAAVMGAAEARNGRWGVLGDYVLTDLSFGAAEAGRQTGNGSVKTRVFTGYAAYRVHRNATMDVDLAAGLRWFKTDAQGAQPGGAAQIRTAGSGEDWIDPVVGLRASFALNDRSSGTFFVDYGGFDGDGETWQVLMTAKFAADSPWTFRAGYRQISVDQDSNGIGFNLERSGPVFGGTFNF